MEEGDCGVSYPRNGVAYERVREEVYLGRDWGTVVTPHHPGVIMR